MDNPTLSPLILQVDFLQSVVDRRTGNQVVLLVEVNLYFFNI